MLDREKLIEIGLRKRQCKINKSWDEINADCGFPFKNGDSFARFMRKQVKKDNIQVTTNNNAVEYKNTVEIHADGRQTSDRLIEMAEEQSKDVNFLLEKHGYDVNQWDLISARNNIWNTYSKLHGVQVLYSSKITVKPKTEFNWSEENIDKLFENINNRNTKLIKPLKFEQNGNMLIVSVVDFHLGLYANERVTGNNYDMQIAENLWYENLKDIISRIDNRKFEKILFVTGNDFANSDNITNTTTKGTAQDSSDYWFNIVDKAIELQIVAIDTLLAIAPIDVLFVPSNHDLHTMYGIMKTLEKNYKNNNNVWIDTSPKMRKYYRFGSNLLGFSHDLKVKDALKIMTSEAKDDWSNCNHMMWILAHLHQSMQYEKHGYLEIRRLPTISGWSRWTNTMGYIQSEKQNQTFIINKDYGVTDILNTNL